MRFIRSIPLSLASPISAPVATLQRVTTWFEYGTLPFHVGYYEAQVSVFSEIIRRYWNGLVWLDEKDGPVCRFQQYRWRGLAEKPIELEIFSDV